jgi:hypothetical protein
MSSITGKISSGTSELQQFGNKKFVSGSSDFLKSNSIIAKLAFLLLVVFVFIILLRLGISVLTRVFSHSTSPILIPGTIDAEKLVVVAQNPGTPGAIPVLRSTDQRDGLEFTWSIWVWIKQPTLANDPTARPNMYRHVFSKGSNTPNSQGILSPNNGPGLYISPNSRELEVIMSTFDNPVEKISIGDIPIEKWVNVIIRCNQLQLDVFINGMLTRSHTLSSVPRQNYDDVFVGMNGGFAGEVSLLQYFATNIGTNQIQRIVDKGPDLTQLGQDFTKTKPRYLSFRWFFPYNSGVMQ